MKRKSKKIETCLFSILFGMYSASCKQVVRPGSDTEASLTATSRDSQRTKLELNDVSILFPMPKDSADLEKMIGFSNLPNDTKKYTLVSQSHFSQVKDIASKQRVNFQQGSSPDNYRSWRIVGFRFDPCFPRMVNSNPNSCSSVELRLVAQPFTDVGGSISAEDFTAHLVYHIGMGERQVLSNELLRLARLSPVNTIGTPLGVHPGLRQEGYQGAFFESVKSLLISRMTISNLAQIAFMGLERTPEPWNFFFVNVSGNKLSGPNSAISLGFLTPKRMNPASRFADNMGLILDRNLEVNEEAMMVTRRIDNPNLHTQASTDCISCHTSTTARLSWESKFGRKLKMGGSAFIPAGNDALGGQVTHKLEEGIQDPDPWNVRNFGYFGTRPQIADRVLNETAAAAIFINRNFLK